MGWDKVGLLLGSHISERYQNSAPHAIGHDGRLRRRMPLGHAARRRMQSRFPTAAFSWQTPESHRPSSDDAVRSYKNLDGTNERNELLTWLH
jgi:hypothetical protein